jgi:hypothetical protein
MFALVEKHGPKIIRFADSGWTKLAAFFVVTAITVAAKMYEDPSSRDYLGAPVQDLFQDHPWTLFLSDILPVPALAIALFFGWLKDSLAKNHPDPITLLGLLDGLAAAVGQKTNARHHKACLLLGHQKIPNAPIHQSNPTEQIKTLVDGIWKVFQREATSRGMPEAHQVKVTLAAMDQQKSFDRFWYFFPTNLAPQGSETFRNERTGFATAADKGDIFILDDIEKELRKERGTCRYLRSQSENGNHGSLICFPIKIEKLHGHPDVPFVLTVKCDTPDIFCESRIRRYRILADPFIDRIRLEFYNHVITEKEERYGNNSTPSAGGKNVPSASQGSRGAKKKNRATIQGSEGD